ncbi:Glycosyltransferase involved in cell wall bisynthesis [Lachnospiraceae bacterium XBD2001]|nr:Glycosyltransferase involved in cell wall bisynthesis [Lachnospiraceae bacterium XBD2001]
MRILLYTLIYPPDTCSNAFVFADMTEELIKQGDEVTVITTTPHYDEEHAIEKRKMLTPCKTDRYYYSSYKGAKVYHIDVLPRKGSTKDRLQTFYRFHKYGTEIIKNEEIEADVVICQTPPMTVGIDCLHLAKQLHAKSAMILQDLWLDAMIDSGRIKGFLAGILRKVEAYQYRHIDLISTIDESMAGRVAQISGLNPIVIPNFVNTEVYRPRNPEDKDYAKYDVEKDKFILSYVGNIGQAQDLEPLVQYAKHNPDACVLVAGNGVREDYYKKRVEEEHISNLRFLGYVTREEARIINSISDVCMILLAEHVAATSFPSKIYSLMAMGKPIMIACSNDTEAGKFIKKHNIGWSCDVRDYQQINAELDEICNHPDERTDRGKNAYQLVLEEYAPDKVVEKYKKAITHMIEKYN